MLQNMSTIAEASGEKLIFTYLPTIIAIMYCARDTPTLSPMAHKPAFLPIETMIVMGLLLLCNIKRQSATQLANKQLLRRASNNLLDDPG